MPWWVPIGAAPDGALVGVGSGLLERPAADAASHGSAHDALGVEAVEDRAEAAALAADQALLLQLDVVEEERPLLVRADVRHRDRVAGEAGRVDVDEAERRQAELTVGQAAAGHDQHRVGVLDARDVGLLAVEEQLVAAALERGGEVVRVGAGVGLGDRERDLGRARRDAAQPMVLLVVGAVAGQDRADDRRRDDDQEQRLAGRRDLLADRGEPGHAEPAAAPLLGEVDAQVALLGERVPELGGRLAGRVLVRE